jgi:serine protease Do
VPSLVSSIKPGSSIEIEVWRERAVRKLTVKVAELKENGEQAADKDDGGDASRGALGLTVRPLRPEERSAAKTDGSLLVEDANGPAQAAGVQAGDIILAVGGTPVRSIADLQAAVKKSGRVVPLLIQRGNAQIFIPVRAGN